MSQDETLDQWIKIFADVYSPDPKVLNPANEAIQEKFENDREFLLNLSTQILLFEDSEDDIIMKAKSLSTVILSQILNIQNNNLEVLRQNLTQNQELTDQIKNALKQNVFSPDASIRNVSAQCYSFLFAILTKYWQDGIDDIIRSFSNETLLPYGFIGLIAIMREIVNLIQDVDGLVPDFNEQFAQTIIFCIDILSKDQSEEIYIPELRIEACRFIHDIIYRYKEIFNDGDTKAARIPHLLDNIPNSFQVSDINLFSMLHQLLFMIVKQFYHQSPAFMEQIASYVGNGFELFQVNKECVNISIYFWKEVATLEENIITKCDIDERLCRAYTEERLETLLSETASEKLIPILLSFMESIDDKDTDVEDVQKNPEPSMYATVTVAAFYKLAPPEIFNIIRQKVEELISTAENWTRIHAAILMIYSIADEPTDDNVCEFISSKFDMLIEASLPQQVPRLQETALFVIGLAIKNYPQIITKVDTDKRITDLINAFEPSLHIDEQQQSNIPPGRLRIFTRYASIIYHLSSAWKGNLFESRINTYFDKFYEILGVLFNYGISNDDHLLIQNASEALNQLIFNATSDLSPRLGDLYKITLDYLEQSKTQSFAPEIRFLIQSSFCSNISTLLLKLKRLAKPCNYETISTYAGRTLELLYELLSNKDTYIYEEGLMAISALVNATSIPPEKEYAIELFNQDTFHSLIDDFIFNGLISCNSGVINASCLLIGNLYFFQIQKIPELVGAVPDIFTALKDIILNNKDMRDSHPFILKAIADIFNSLDRAEGAIPDLENELHDLLIKIYDISTELDITMKNDVEYGNLFYQYLTDAFGGYAKIYYNSENQEKEREQLFLLDKLANYVYKLSPRIDDNLYLNFAKTARQFAENCSRRNNVILNRHSVHRIMKQGFEEAKNQESKKRIKAVMDYLKSK